MGISTHVLDLATGRPAAGVPVRLEWGGRVVAEGATGRDGRVQLVSAAVDPGTYRLIFDTAAYGNDFFPEVSVVFRVEDGSGHHHVPLLLSPHGYTTYRGS